MSRTWHIVTGEYPPKSGGVSDYTRQVATGLVAHGEQVHVWTPGDGQDREDAGVNVHSLFHGFQPRGLLELTRRSARLRGSKRWLIQYVAQAYGVRGANLPFAAWVSARPRGDRVWVMFHEVRVGWGTLRLSVLSVAHRLMARALVRRADVCLVSTPTWNALLPASVRNLTVWVPIPSNLPTQVRSADVDEVRRGLAVPGSVLLGHFGTYSPLHRQTLTSVLPALLGRDVRRQVILLGRGNADFADGLRQTAPKLAARIHSPLGLTASALAAHLAACDVLVQPFEDGVTSRRTSLMAGLALAKPVVTNAGRWSEALWLERPGVALASSPAPAQILETAEYLLETPEAWPGLGEQARQLYESTFSIESTLTKLTEQAALEALAPTSVIS